MHEPRRAGYTGIDARNQAIIDALARLPDAERLAVLEKLQLGGKKGSF